MKNQRFLSALAATVMAVSLFTCTALAANEPADTAASEPTQQTEVVTADTDTGSEKGALAKYSDFITSTGGELLVVGICAVGLGALYLTKGKKGGKRKRIPPSPRIPPEQKAFKRGRRNETVKKERLASLLMTGVIMASTVVSASAMQFPQDVYYPSDDTGLAQKVYMVETEKEIELLDRSSFTYKGKTYNYLDMTVEPQEVHDEKNMVKKVSGESDTNDKAKILATLEVNLDEVTEDGYAGELTLDASTLTTTVTEYGKGSQKKTVTKTYPGMSDGDLSLVPKTVTSGGATLQLVNCSWSEDAQYNPYDPDIGNRFTATATYSGKVGYSYAKGYAYEVNYYGTVEKDEVEGYLCTLLFAPEEEPSHWYDVYLNEDGTTNGFMVLFTVLFFAMLVGLLYFLWPILFGKKEDKTVTVEEIYQNQPDEKKK